MLEDTRRTNQQWLRELGADDAVADVALADLRTLVGRAVRRAVSADEATLDDLVQVAVVHVLRQLHRFEGRSRFETWAWSVAVRAALGERRRAVYRASGQPISTLEREPASDAPSPADDLERAEIVSVMHSVIDQELTAHQRRALLGLLSETPRPELAAALGVNANALNKLLFDARRKLHAGLRAAGICETEVRQTFDL